MAWFVKVSLPASESEVVARKVIDFSDNIESRAPKTRRRGWRLDYFFQGRKLAIGPVWMRIQLENVYSTIPDVLQIHGPWMVSDTFRRLVEEREPNVHQFFPVEVQTVDGAKWPDQRHLLNIGQRLPAALRERSKLFWVTRSDGSQWTSPPRVDNDLVVGGNVVHGKHLWMDDMFSEEGRFISNDLKIAFDAAGIHGLEYVHVREEI